jgi:hypothetical protein
LRILSTELSPRWGSQEVRILIEASLPPRNQPSPCKRELAWVTRCERLLTEYPYLRRMDAIVTDAVTVAINDLGPFAS